MYPTATMKTLIRAVMLGYDLEYKERGMSYFAVLPHREPDVTSHIHSLATTKETEFRLKPNSKFTQQESKLIEHAGLRGMFSWTVNGCAVEGRLNVTEVTDIIRANHMARIHNDDLKFTPREPVTNLCIHIIPAPCPAPSSLMGASATVAGSSCDDSRAPKSSDYVKTFRVTDTPHCEATQMAPAERHCFDRGRNLVEIRFNRKGIPVGAAIRKGTRC